jgi:thiamine-phosphate pyrophosphorylase
MTTYTKEQVKEILKIYFIMGSNNSKLAPEYVLEEALKGGISVFQFREKGNGALKGDAKFQLAKRMQKLCIQYNVPFIVNDDIELAISLDADGVHIGQEDENAIKVRERIGNKVLGVSAHSIEEIKAAVEAGADYIGIGPIYPTSTKKDAKAVQGTRLIEKVKEENLTIPIVGIGGITTENAFAVIRAGADGVAIISEISMAANPYDQTKRLEKVVLGQE